MRSYKDYEKLAEKYQALMAEKVEKEGMTGYSLEPSDYVIFGNLMKEITESVKMPESRQSILAFFGNETDGYRVSDKIKLKSLMVVAICLSAALDKNISQDKLKAVIKKYHNDDYKVAIFNQYTQIAEKELQQSSTTKR